MDKYEKTMLKAIKQSSSDDETVNIINKIYVDGFRDGLGDAEKSKGRKLIKQLK